MPYMIKKVCFKNFRNLNCVFDLHNNYKIIVGKNNAGKTNFIDGLKLILSMITGDYFKVSQSDFANSDDSVPIGIEIEFDYNDIPTLNCEHKNNKICGAIANIFKSKSGKYVKELRMLNGGPIDYDILREDKNIPNVSSIPIIRTEEIYSSDFVTGINNFIDQEEQYRRIREESKKAIKNEINDKATLFHDFCTKFGQELNN